MDFPEGYPQVLEEIKARIRTARVKVALSANRELISLYWDIGKMIVKRQENEGWGRAVVERLSADILKEFPNVRGYSPQNLLHMRSLYLAWTNDVGKLPQTVGEMEGKMSFYLSAVEEVLPNRAGQSAIGLILCKDRSRTIVVTPE